MSDGAIFYALGAFTFGPGCFVVGYLLADVRRIEWRRRSIDDHGPKLRVIHEGHLYQATKAKRKP